MSQPTDAVSPSEPVKDKETELTKAPETEKAKETEAHDHKQTEAHDHKADAKDDKQHAHDDKEHDLDRRSSQAEFKLTPEQNEVFVEFQKKVRETITEIAHNDFTMLRFLRARKFKIDAAFEMYSNYLKWRKTCKIDEIVDNPPTEIRSLLAKFVPESFHKFDKFGLPAYFMKLGHVRCDELMRHITQEEFIKAHIWGMEYSFQRAAESSKRLGKNIDQFVNVVDLSGMTMGHRKALKYVKAVAALDEKYYPEALGKTYIINAPWVFPVLWKIVAPWVDPVTRAKMAVLRGNYKETLLERFHAEDLPSEFGGECKCSPSCVRVYTDAEVAAVIAEQEKKLHLESVNVLAGASHEMTIPIENALGGLIEYYFKTVKNDVGFAAVFTPADKAKPPVRWMELTRYAGKTLSKGSFDAKEAGVAVFEFNNKHSYFAPKTVEYKFNLRAHDESDHLEEHVRRVSISSNSSSANTNIDHSHDASSASASVASPSASSSSATATESASASASASSSTPTTSTQ